jgi:KaiC/GvpD/RAD55 family RecA-like ATPase
MVEEIERVPSGIYGLDPLIEGGFPKGRTILVSGGAGTGKTIFGMQYVYKGIEEYDEPGIFVTLDERPRMIRQDMARFGFDIEKYEKKGDLVIMDASAAKIGYPSEEKYSMPQMGIDVDRLLLRISQIAGQIKAKRLVVDSISGFGMHIDQATEVRKAVLKTSYMLLKSNLTAVITSEIPEQPLGAGPMEFSKYGVEEYVADGVVVLHYLGVGTESNRNMFVRKMRGTKHVEDILPMEISKKGLVVRRPEETMKL